MKTLINTLAIAILSLFFVSTGHTADGKKMDHDGIMMKDGKMMVHKDGKSMAMDKEMTLDNGTKVMMDGTCMMKDGTKTMMKNGDMVHMDGTMMTGKMKDKK